VLGLALAFLVLPAVAPAEIDSEAGEVVVEMYGLGPLPAPPSPPAEPPLHATIDPVPEIDPAGGLPSSGQRVSLAPGVEKTWRRLAAGEAGEIHLDGPGVFWLAARVQVDRWTELTLTAVSRAALTLYLDGEERASGEALATDEEPLADEAADESGPEPVTASVEVARGSHEVLVRLEIPSTAASLSLTARAEPAAGLGWSLEPRIAPADFDRSREVASISGLAVAPKGKLVARRLSRREATGERRRTTVEVLDAEGRVVAADLGGGSARPVAFSPDGKRLLLRKSGSGGTNLVLWTAPDGPLTTVLENEPGLGLVRFSPDGRHLLLASERGAEEDEPGGDAARRRQHLREKVPDYAPLPHLHLIEIASGARRRLSAPGDFVLDDAVFRPDGRAVIYGRTLPRPERPWFHTEIRLLDLPSGQDRLVADFVAGWEVRPQAFAVSPDGRKLAFLGPPDQIGGGRPEHNVYNLQVWLLDLDSGDLARISRGLPFAFAAGAGLPAFESRGSSLLVGVTAGSCRKLARLVLGAERAEVVTLSPAGRSVGATALAPDGSFFAYTISDPVNPPALHLLDARRGRDRVLESPNADLAARWLVSTHAEASFTGPGGQEIDAWFYPPSVPVPDEADRTPLIVYYYGGCSPTTRAFNTTHQFFAANGYAVLVINPRGAFGYGDDFADFHAGDWGPHAGADILAGIDACLAARPEVDGDRIGIYGGSYGGFMTGYLVTTSDRFAAAVSMYGISDLATYWGQGAWGWTYGDMALGGVMPWSHPEEFVAKSPLFRAERVQTPLLLLHGLSDTNVTPGQSEELFTALSVQNKLVELVLFPGEDHGISGSFANRVAHRTMMLEWFDRFLRDLPEAWQARWE